MDDGKIIEIESRSIRRTPTLSGFVVYGTAVRSDDGPGYGRSPHSPGYYTGVMPGYHMMDMHVNGHRIPRGVTPGYSVLTLSGSPYTLNLTLYTLLQAHLTP